MSQPSLIVAPGPKARSVVANEKVTDVPSGWELLAPGDAGLTRRVKAAGPTWTVQEKKGRRTFSKGIWAPAEIISAERSRLDAERALPTYAKKREADSVRREKKQSAYVEDFHSAVVAFLDFAPCYVSIARQLATAVTAHATPVGSGTVARTQRIPIEKRAEAAVIAWMRHQTTGYDEMKIARIKGERREVRRQLAAQSKKLLEAYRRGAPIRIEACPLQQGLKAPMNRSSAV